MNDSLNFELPYFKRYSWVSESARQAWEPRLERIRNAWREMEWRSAGTDIRRCAAVIVGAAELPGIEAKCSAAGMSALPAVKVRGTSGLQVAIGKPSICSRFASAAAARDMQAQGKLLGYPRCCIAAYCVASETDSPFDPIWLAALRTVPAQEDGRTAVIAAGPGIDLILCHALDLWRTFHIPCRFDCRLSLRLAGRIRAFGESLGYAEEMLWQDEVFSWPVEWSALHGIAEIRTPVVRVATRTVATASRYAIRFMGNGFPAEGSKGLGFPYRAPRRPSRPGELRILGAGERS